MCIQAKQMAENEQGQEIIPMLNINNQRRHLSQIPIPSHGLILKKSPEGFRTVSAMRKRRTVSEQINRHDR